MKFNPKSLKSFFNFIRQSPIDDMAVNAVKNNADGVAMGALNAVDDIPSSISFDDIADAYKNRIPADKPPITPAEFKKQFYAELPARQETREVFRLFPELENTAASKADLDAISSTGFDLSEPFKMDSTPDYDAMDVRPERFGQSPYAIDHVLYPDGFEDPEDFARYYDALEQGYATAQMAPYIYPTHSRIPWRSPMRNKLELGAVQQALDPYTVSGDIPANSPELAKLYKKNYRYILKTS